MTPSDTLMELLLQVYDEMDGSCLLYTAYNNNPPNISIVL